MVFFNTKHFCEILTVLPLTGALSKAGYEFRDFRYVKKTIQDRAMVTMER